MIPQRKLSKWFVIPCVIVTLVACGEKEQEAQTAPVKPKVKNSQSSKVVTGSVDGSSPVVQEIPQKYSYNVENRRDPFQPYLLINRPVDTDADLSAQTPLQQYETLQYKLAGVIVGYGQPMAMVIAPNGKSYVVSKGIKIGKSGGTVVQINKEGILVEEKYRDLLDTIRTNMLEIKLPKREGV